MRLGLMTPDEVATTMREEAETGRSFAELAVESGRLNAEDLANLTGETARPAAVAPEPGPAPASFPDPDPERSAAGQADREREPAADRTNEPVAAAAPDLEPEVEPLHVEPASRVTARVFVCLMSGERIAAGSFDEQAAAEERARELMTALDDNRQWPRLEGRFIRPDAVVSIDVELDEQ